MEFQRQSFSDVVLDLARRYQLPVETVDGPQQERLRQQLSRRVLQRALALAAAGSAVSFWPTPGEMPFATYR